MVKVLDERLRRITEVQRFRVSEEATGSFTCPSDSLWKAFVSKQDPRWIDPLQAGSQLMSWMLLSLISFLYEPLPQA